MGVVKTGREGVLIRGLEEGRRASLSEYGFSILQIETMLACDMKCGFCAYPIIESKGSKLSDEEVCRVINSVDAGDDRLEYICFSQYNEPLLDKRTFEFVRYAKEKGFRTLVITNGLSFRLKDIRDKLIEVGSTYMKISFQTLNEKAFLSSRGTTCPFEEYKRGVFEFLRSSLERGLSSKITIDIACNFISRGSWVLRALLGLEQGDPSVPNAIEDIEEDFINFLKELHDYNPELIFDEARARRYLKTAEKDYLDQEELSLSRNVSVKIKRFIYGRRLSDFYPAFKFGGGGCSTRILSVLADGTVAPCCLAYDVMLSMGNIKKESLGQILERSKGLIAGIKEGSHLTEVCRRCKGAPTRRGSLAISLWRLLR